MAQVIVIAQGIEIRSVGQGTILQAFLTANCDRKGAAPAAGANNTWRFPKGSAAKATHEIRVVYGMADLAAALDLADALVVYEGHSRYGQGPAFGPEGRDHVLDKKKFPVNLWGVHFRMGYDATDTECVGDLLEHSVMPVEHDLTVANPKAFLPSALVTATTNVRKQDSRIRAKKVKAKDVCGLTGAWRPLDVCQPARSGTKTARGELPLKGRHYYVHKDHAKPEEFLTAVKVGSADIDKAKLACRVLFMASCSSKVHFHAALIRRRTAAKSACRFLLTGQVCQTSHATTFLKQVLIKKLDPTAKRDMNKIVKALNGELMSGNVGVY
ncbi:MAG TPA: hypothetical protein VK501_28180 [Baekduia sp.]|uniref:hypothetical protein n=1 Tax=Baekduia sp. TaxID=2600305 RepID=UPI002C34ACEB|nr:hypothetical protein [Baekduia sp.]HMJ37819.1 hypothetical protein [Baekduia sp.]